MKYTMLLVLGLTMCLAAEPPKQEAKTPAGLPAGAVPAGERTWRYTDKSGKTWLYFQTPFGFSKSEEKAAEAIRESAAKAEKTAAPAFKIVSVKGNEVAFERDSPFGKSKWTKKKSDLSADEVVALEQFESAAPAAAKK